MAGLRLLPLGAAASVLPWDEKNLPDASWPAATAQASNAAWPSGAQPASLVAWPKGSEGQPAPCWNVSVLEDTEDGWAGNCLGLSAVEADTEAKCGLACRQDAVCPSWQFNSATGCWTGVGESCDREEGRESVLRAQRLQHGVVRVLRDMRGVEVMNLRFLGKWSTGAKQDGVRRCRNWCYSNVHCQYWLYGEDGCWVEDPSSGWNSVQYPLTTSGGCSTTSEWAKTSVAGEFIQHICPPKAAVHADYKPAGASLPLAPWDPHAPANAWLPWASVGALLSVAFCLGCTLLGRGHGDVERRKKPAQKRALQTRPSEEPQLRSTETGGQEGACSERQALLLSSPGGSEAHRTQVASHGYALGQGYAPVSTSVSPGRTHGVAPSMQHFMQPPVLQVHSFPVQPGFSHMAR